MKGDYSVIGYMSFLESSVGIICACMPAVRLLLSHAIPSVFGSTLNAGSRTYASASGSAAYGNIYNTHSGTGVSKTITNTTTPAANDTDSMIELVEQGVH